jgi:alpha-1,2-mannosyltransferase
MLAFTVLAFLIRIYTLTRSGYMTGVTEYDDGVYLGGAVRLLQGALPYRDWAYVQPPGILLLMTPVALLTKVTTITHAMAAARVLTVLASTACVPLAGSLVRYRGTLVTLVTCGILAVYPDDITTAHTLILEPWMNLLLLIGVCLAFREGRLASPRWLLWSGVAIGVAGAVKFWAALPALVLLVVCLLTKDERGRRTVSYVIGVAVGFLVPVLPFALLAPVTFVRSTLLDQAARAGSYVPRSMRLAHITGLIDFLNAKAQITFSAGTHSLFASGGAAATPETSAGSLPYVVFAIAIIIVAGGYFLQPGRLSPLESFAIVTAVLATAAVVGYSAFFYHYPDFAAPWIAVAAGGAFGALSKGHLSDWLAREAGGARRVRRGLIGLLSLVLVLLAAFQVREISGLAAPDIYPDQAAIPAGACVVTDQISLTIAANRFTSARGGCPDVMDSLAETLVTGNGVSVQGGAASLPKVVADWRSIFARADYVWLSPNNARRIPWTPGLDSWFNSNFAQVPAYHGLGKVYKRTGA